LAGPRRPGGARGMAPAGRRGRVLGTSVTSAPFTHDPAPDGTPWEAHISSRPRLRPGPGCSPPGSQAPGPRLAWPPAGPGWAGRVHPSVHRPGATTLRQDGPHCYRPSDWLRGRMIVTAPEGRPHLRGARDAGDDGDLPRYVTVALYSCNPGAGLGLRHRSPGGSGSAGVADCARNGTATSNVRERITRRAARAVQPARPPDRPQQDRPRAAAPGRGGC
jgi:hypothetical protein